MSNGLDGQNSPIEMTAEEKASADAARKVKTYGQYEENLKALEDRHIAATDKQHKEEVVHPDHYNQYKGFEVIDVCEQLVGPDGKSGFNLGNAFKYIARAGWKDPVKQVQDLEKAVFYINREIGRLKEN